jgi:hypothetical protein
MMLEKEKKDIIDARKWTRLKINMNNKSNASPNIQWSQSRINLYGEETICLLPEENKNNQGL